MFPWLKIKPQKKISSPVENYSRRCVARMYPIFQKQGYRNARIGKILRGSRNIIIPVYPSLQDISEHRDIHNRWLSLADNVGKATGSVCYAEWSEKNIFYFIQMPDVHWKDLELSSIPGIGRTEYGMDIHYKFSDNYPHSLVAGSTGSGKSVGLESIIISLVKTHSPEELGLIVIDPHDSFGRRQDKSLGTFDNIPHLVFGNVAKSTEDIDDQLRWAYSQLGLRKGMSRDETFGLRRIVIVADELASQQVLGQGKKVHEEHLTIFNTLGSESRKYKINLIGGTQKPEDIDTGVFDHLLYRFVGKTSDNKLGSRILGKPGYKISSLSGRGDFLVSEDFVTRFQFALPNQKDFDSLPRGGIIELPSTPSIEPGRIEVTEAPKPGRPPLEIDYLKLAYYLLYRDKVTEEQARIIKGLQLKRRGHELHRDKAQELISNIIRLRKVPFSKLERLEQ